MGTISADFDPAIDGTDMYLDDERFTMDYSKAAGKQWTYKGIHHDPWRYPDDPRMHTVLTSAMMCRISGQRFLILTDMGVDEGRCRALLW
jgi:hypothetical protein